MLETLQQCAAYGFFFLDQNQKKSREISHKHWPLNTNVISAVFQCPGSFFFPQRIWWEWEVRTIYPGDLWSQMPLMLFVASSVLQQPDRLNSIMAVWCVETPEVRANSSVYTPESLSQTKTNTFIGFQDLVCCDCPTAFEVSHRFMLFTYSCSFFPSDHHGVFRWNNFSTVWNNVWAEY